VSFDRDADFERQRGAQMERLSLLLRARHALNEHGSSDGLPPRIDYRLVEALFEILEEAAAREMVHGAGPASEPIQKLAKAVLEVCGAAR
jgi:hypothetical protein